MWWVIIEFVGTCVIVGDGFKGRYLDCMQLPRPTREARILPQLRLYLVYVLLWFVVVYMNATGIVCDVV